MHKPYLEVTYRQGKPFAAYLYLDRRPGDAAAATRPHANFLVDYAPDGRPIGIEFTRLTHIDLAAVNQILDAAHQSSLSSHDLAPLSAA